MFVPTKHDIEIESKVLFRTINLIDIKDSAKNLDLSRFTITGTRTTRRCL